MIRSRKLNSDLFIRRTESCNINGGNVKSNLDIVDKHEMTLIQKTKLEHTTPHYPSKTRLSATPDRANKSLHRQNFLELIADPNYYHTVHGGQKKHITASRSAEPFAPITRLSIGDRSFIQAYQANVGKAVSTATSPSNSFGAQKQSLKLVRLFVNDPLRSS